MTTQVTFTPPPTAPLSENPSTDRTWRDWFRDISSYGISTKTTSTSASNAAGGITLPTNPAGFILITIKNTNYKVPYYNV